MPPLLRGQLSGVTEVYFYAAQSKPSTILVSAADEAIRTWIIQTRTLRNTIWTSQKRKPIEPTATSNPLGPLLKKSSSKQNKKSRLHPPLEQFAEFLNGVEAVGAFFSRRLTNSRATGADKTEVWFVWAALVLTILRTSNIWDKEASKKQLSQRSLMLVDRLQTTLIESYDMLIRADQKGISPVKMPFKHGESLQKAIRHAAKFAEEHSEDQLFAHLVLGSSILFWWELEETTKDLLKTDGLRTQIRRAINSRRVVSRTGQH